MKTNWQDPVSGDIDSYLISGLQEAVGKMETVLDMQVVAVTDQALTEVNISDSDRYRIYQIAGKRNWVADPAPVIKKNGSVISSGFTIDYGGGAVVFSPRLTSTDAVTASFTYVKGQSGTIGKINLRNLMGVRYSG